MNKVIKKASAGILAMLMAVSLILAPNNATVVKAGAVETHTFDTTTIPSAGVTDKQPFEEGTAFCDGYYRIVGTVTQRLTGEGATKCIELGKGLSGGLEFTITGYAIATLKLSSTGTDNTSPFGLLNVETGEIVANNEGLDTVKTTSSTKVTYDLTAGTYQVVSPASAEFDRGARIFSIEVSESMDGPIAPRIDWSEVSAVKITSIEATEDGKIAVAFTGVVGYDGGDYIDFTMTASDKSVAQTIQYVDDCEEGVVYLTPSASDTYSIGAAIGRNGFSDKLTFPTKFEYVLPVAKAYIATASSVGNGGIKVTWGAVKEADKYEVYCDDKLVATTDSLSYTMTGLAIDSEHAFAIAALRGSEKGELSDAVKAVASKDAVIAWGFTRYGSSTNDENNGYEGDAKSGKVTVYSEGGKGKIVPNSTDGLAFYYTAIPTDQNFTLKAKAHVDSWTFSNGQDGFGIMAADRLGTNGDSTAFWNNQYMAVASKIEYYWNEESKAPDVAGTKYSMKLGLGVIAKTGVTKDNLELLNINDTTTVNEQFKTETRTLETTAPLSGQGSGTYNIVGNATAAVDGTIAEITDFVLEIQKNNTGYFVSYYDTQGELVSQEKFYEPDALSQADDENVYVGFFASRNARVTFSDIELTTVAAADDAAAEERPVTEVAPTLNINSASVANTENYSLVLYSNVDGTVTVKLDGKTVVDKTAMTAGERFEVASKLTSKKDSEYSVEFVPAADYVPGEYMVLANTDTINLTHKVTRNTSFEKLYTIYVSPDGKATNTGRIDSPLDIYTAVKFVQPGQKIVLAGGTYSLSSTVRIERGIDGTAENLIYMIADPNASERPVFDFGGKCAGMVLGGNYWYFQGFDCTNSANGQKGIQVSGNCNTLDNINAYHNGNTGIQISRLYSTDLFANWPAENHILNCTSYGNADSGYEDADGFAAKLTVGNGNVFEGCIAYNNADDGWDLFAKVETGSIGAVTIMNCIAYGNGYLEDGTNAGNGNGFKMGGDSLSGYHKLINSYAFFNKAKGIDSNSCPDIQVENCISFNNESYNVAFYTNNAPNTDFAAFGILSFKDASIKSGLDKGEQFKPVGSQDTSKYLGDTNYYWDGTKSANASGAVADASWFKSLTFTEITRNADNTINMGDFLALTDAAPAGVGAKADRASTASMVFSVAENPKASSGNTVVIAVIVAAVAAALVAAYAVFASKKKKA